jgi:homocysteine S-methyltransferase
MGTSLIAEGAPVESCFEAFNVHDPARVEWVHRGFVEAGARLLLTNTFGGNRFRLERHGAADRVRAFNRAAVGIARRSGAPFVGGSVGPLGVRLTPYGRVRPEQALEAFREQIDALVDGGVDLLAIETQSDLAEIEQALTAAREADSDLAVVVTATFTRDDRTLLGSTPEKVARRLAELGADAIGVNCGEGPAQALRVLAAMRPWSGGIPLVARPNAGGPREVGGRLVYPATPGYFANHVRGFLAESAAVVGGCCGAGPAHTRAMAMALATAEDRPRIPDGDSTGVSAPHAADRRQTMPSAARSTTRLQDKLASGRPVVSVEVEPPRSHSAAALIAAAETLAEAGADVIDVADNPLAKMRMSAWAVCRLIHERAGIETVLHFPTRGRNILRLQGDLLGAHALGIQNVFVCAGDPVTIGEFPQGSNDLDVTATGLLALINREFNHGVAHGGAPLGEPTAFFSGAAVAPNADDLERECRLLKKKVDAGAGFLLSQPIYDAAALARLREVYARVTGEALSVPILVGVLPLVTARHAEFLHNEVPGIVIPSEVRGRLAVAGDSTRAGIEIATELMSALLEGGAGGVYLMPQFGRYDVAAEVVEAARALAPA